MTDQPTASDNGLTTDQIASVSASDVSESTSPVRPPAPPHHADQLASEQAYRDRREPADTEHPEPADTARPVQLFEGHELQSVRSRWQEIQAEFVDEPRSAVQEADKLVADLMQRLAQVFAAERDQLESRWASGEQVSTEDLRQGLQRYRSFFERLLAA
jgi:molecular chaperone GrpE (heat shock protein)